MVQTAVQLLTEELIQEQIHKFAGLLPVEATMRLEAVQIREAIQELTKQEFAAVQIQEILTPEFAAVLTQETMMREFAITATQEPVQLEVIKTGTTNAQLKLVRKKLQEVTQMFAPAHQTMKEVL